MLPALVTISPPLAPCTCSSARWDKSSALGRKTSPRRQRQSSKPRHQDLPSPDTRRTARTPASDLLRWALGLQVHVSSSGGTATCFLDGPPSAWKRNSSK